MKTLLVTQDWWFIQSLEWFLFAEQSLDNGFYSIAKKACKRALKSIQMNSMVDPENDDCFSFEHAIEKVKRLKGAAMILASSRSDSGIRIYEDENNQAACTTGCLH